MNPTLPGDNHDSILLSEMTWREDRYPSGPRGSSYLHRPSYNYEPALLLDVSDRLKQINSEMPGYNLLFSNCELVCRALLQYDERRTGLWAGYDRSVIVQRYGETNPGRAWKGGAIFFVNIGAALTVILLTLPNRHGKPQHSALVTCCALLGVLVLFFIIHSMIVRRSNRWNAKLLSTPRREIPGRSQIGFAGVTPSQGDIHFWMEQRDLQASSCGASAW